VEHLGLSLVDVLAMQARARLPAGRRGVMRGSIPAVSMNQRPAKPAFAGVSEDRPHARSYSLLGITSGECWEKTRLIILPSYPCERVENPRHLQENGHATRGLWQLRFLSSRA
jgi:hypothetical protein